MPNKRLWKKGLVIGIIILFLGTIYVEADSRSGITAYWNFDEGSGNIVYDSSGNNYDGEIYGAFWTSDSVSDYALHFDGFDDYVDVGYISGNVYSYNIWIKPDNDITMYFPNTGLSLFTYDANNHFGLSLGDCTSQMTGEVITIWDVSEPDYFSAVLDITITKDLYHMITLVWNSVSNSYDIYFDADLQPVVEGGVGHVGLMNSHNFNLAKISYTYYKGDIDEVSIYDYSLNSNEVQDLYNSHPPNEPSNPIPPDGENYVDINADFSWNCSDPDGDPLTYNVYFGTISNPPLVVSGITEKMYDPGKMNFNETYYWKIVAEDIHKATNTSPIWTFTTKINNPPDAPIINGPIKGRTIKSYPYKFISTDPEKDEVSYFVDWGDGVTTTWTEWRPSGPPGYIQSHSWDIQGTYIIQAKAKDKYGTESDWTELTVTITKGKDKEINPPFLQFLESHSNLFPILQKIIQRLVL